MYKITIIGNRICTIDNPKFRFTPENPELIVDDEQFSTMTDVQRLKDDIFAIEKISKKPEAKKETKIVEKPSDTEVVAVEVKQDKTEPERINATDASATNYEQDKAKAKVETETEVKAEIEAKPEVEVETKVEQAEPAQVKAPVETVAEVNETENSDTKTVASKNKKTRNKQTKKK